MILPPATLGMLGGGQLGRFFVTAAHELGYQVWVLDPDKNSPAGQIAERHFCVDYADYAALDEFAAGCAAMTTEFENVPAATLDYLAKFVPVRPQASAVAICQHRVSEKNFLREHGFPHGPFITVDSENDLKSAPASLFPAILKVARFGYDGKGQATVNNVEEALLAFGKFKGEQCVLEQRLVLDYEVSVVLARDQRGQVACFPTSENLHTRGILDVSIVPARTTGCVKSDAEDVAARIAEKLGYIGTMGVEFFVSRGQLIVNEMAPRPHNSGHYTIDACVSNQFEQQVRALCGLPLGEPRAHSASVMVNLLGDLWYDEDVYREPDWSLLLAIPNLKLHLYGKHHARPGRKMGHFTVIGENAETVQQLALAARAAIGIKD
ncbi:MAG: 5-(carboxyamino)imidazole ribonucleotide synthase [Dechloromonas sp.]|nr:5-(carboxyamino)imidazole ribonucleotide synthase [Dechloromonas sp.]